MGKKKLKRDPFRRFLLSIADKKGCWLKDLEGIDWEELIDWAAYYEMKPTPTRGKTNG
jgi:hypothetical protein